MDEENNSQVKALYADKEEKTSYTKVIISGGIIVILILLLVISIAIVRNRVTILSQAYGTGNVEIANSYIFASPIKAKAGTEERVRLTAFILDSRGKGVFGKTVIIGQSEQVKIIPIQPNTDDLGKAVFDVTSSVVGYYLIEASVDGKVIPQRVGVTFE
jgi:hypothetical protein